MAGSNVGLSSASVVFGIRARESGRTHANGSHHYFGPVAAPRLRCRRPRALEDTGEAASQLSDGALVVRGERALALFNAPHRFVGEHLGNPDFPASMFAEASSLLRERLVDEGTLDVASWSVAKVSCSLDRSRTPGVARCTLTDKRVPFEDP
jgi:hypothetical protein